MDHHFKFRIKEIHDALNKTVLERSINIVYDLLYTYFFRDSELRNSFKVIGSIYKDGIDIEIVTGLPAEEAHKMRSKPVKQAMVDKSGVYYLSQLASAKSSLKSAFTEGDNRPEGMKSGLRPVTGRLKRVERGHLNRRMLQDSKKMNVHEYINSPGFKRQYEERLEKFIFENMRTIENEIKAPILKVMKNVKA